MTEQQVQLKIDESLNQIRSEITPREEDQAFEKRALKSILF
jgi:hypothetical protein